MAEHWVLSALRGAAVVLGFAVAFLSYLAYRRYGSKLLLSLTLGFGILALGAVVEGLLFEVFAFPLDQAHLLESTITLAALLTLALRLNWPRGGG